MDRQITTPDALWLMKLLTIVEYMHAEYPEIFTEKDEETLAIARELIRSLQ